MAFPGFGSTCGAGGSAGMYLKSSPYSMNGIGLTMAGMDTLHPTMGYPPPSEYLYGMTLYSFCYIIILLYGMTLYSFCYIIILLKLLKMNNFFLLSFIFDILIKWFFVIKSFFLSFSCYHFKRIE